MDDFPAFMKHPANRIATGSQATPGVEGYVFDGVDGSQMAFWTCQQTAVSASHAHDFDEYMTVVQGCYTLIIDGQRIPVKAGEEYLIPRGVEHAGEVLAGTRTIHLVWRPPVGPFCRRTIVRRVRASGPQSAREHPCRLSPTSSKGRGTRPTPAVPPRCARP